MPVDMVEMKVHDVEVNGVRHQVRTGRVTTGWWWKCSGFECDGVKASREAALADAKAEITARTV